MTATEPMSGERREPISPERLAQIREECGPRSVYLSGVAGDGLVVMANQLLDEIDRLTEVLHANSVVRNAAESSCRVYKTTFLKVRGERDQERTEVKRLAKRADLLDSSLDAMRQQAVEAVKERNAATTRAKTAERELAESLDALTVAAELIDRLAFDDECDYDHHDYCQAHNLQERPCPHPLGRQFVEAWHAVEAEKKAANDA